MAIAIALQFLTERKRPNNINSARCQVRDLCKGHLNAEFANRNGVPVSKKNCSLVGSHSYRKSPLCIRKSSASHQWVNRFGKKHQVSTMVNSGAFSDANCVSSRGSRVNSSLPVTVYLQYLSYGIPIRATTQLQCHQTWLAGKSTI